MTDERNQQRKQIEAIKELLKSIDPSLIHSLVAVNKDEVARIATQIPSLLRDMAALLSEQEPAIDEAPEVKPFDSTTGYKLRVIAEATANAIDQIDPADHQQRLRVALDGYLQFFGQSLQSALVDFRDSTGLDLAPDKVHVSTLVTLLKFMAAKTTAQLGVRCGQVALLCQMIKSGNHDSATEALRALSDLQKERPDAIENMLDIHAPALSEFFSHIAAPADETPSNEIVNVERVWTCAAIEFELGSAESRGHIEQLITDLDWMNPGAFFCCPEGSIFLQIGRKQILDSIGVTERQLELVAIGHIDKRYGYNFEHVIAIGVRNETGIARLYFIDQSNEEITAKPKLILVAFDWMSFAANPDFKHRPTMIPSIKQAIGQLENLLKTHEVDALVDAKAGMKYVDPDELLKKLEKHAEREGSAPRKRF